MKTQIKDLKTGKIHKHGTNYNIVQEVWKKIVSENPEEIKLKIHGKTYTLTANYSISGKSVDYFGYLPKEDLDIYGIVPAKRETPYISMQDANEVIVSNGKNSYTYVNPANIEII